MLRLRLGHAIASQTKLARVAVVLIKSTVFFSLWICSRQGAVESFRLRGSTTSALSGTNPANASKSMFMLTSKNTLARQHWMIWGWAGRELFPLAWEQHDMSELRHGAYDPLQNNCVSIQRQQMNTKMYTGPCCYRCATDNAQCPAIKKCLGQASIHYRLPPYLI